MSTNLDCDLEDVKRMLEVRDWIKILNKPVRISWNQSIVEAESIIPYLVADQIWLRIVERDESFANYQNVWDVPFSQIHYVWRQVKK